MLDEGVQRNTIAYNAAISASEKGEKDNAILKKQKNKKKNKVEEVEEEKQETGEDVEEESHEEAAT